MSISYTPISISYVSAIKSDSSTSITEVYEEHTLLIDVVPSAYRSTMQTLPQQTVITIPDNRVLRLELLPSCSCDPPLRYRVQYYANQKLVYTQYWRVPPPPSILGNYTLNILNGSDSLPPNFFSIESITPNTSYTINGNIINIPVDGEYVITFRQALTLNDLAVNE